jgi:hypothetical protein
MTVTKARSVKVVQRATGIMDTPILINQLESEQRFGSAMLSIYGVFAMDLKRMYWTLKRMYWTKSH